jgi:hypothetical protein
MPYYKDNQNAIYFLGDAAHINFLPTDCVLVPEVEALNIANPPPTLDVLKVTTSNTLADNFVTAIGQSVSYMGTTFQADKDSRDKLVEVLISCKDTLPVGFYWVDALNNQVPMTLLELQGLSQAMMAQGWTAFQKLQTLKTKANAASSAKVLATVIW